MHKDASYTFGMHSEQLAEQRITQLCHSCTGTCKVQCCKAWRRNIGHSRTAKDHKVAMAMHADCPQLCAVLAVSDCLYTPCFCEENAYKLCKQLCKRCAGFHVAFISNLHVHRELFHCCS